MIKVKINDKPTNLKPDINIEELLDFLDYKSQWLGVAINTEFVAKDKHKDTILLDGDSVEILSPIQGG